MSTPLPATCFSSTKTARFSRLRIAYKVEAFSLVEIALALAIVAFAFVALLGLLPPGMRNFRAAMDVQTSTEIYQRVIADAQETDFDTLISLKSSTDYNGIAVEIGGNAGQFYRLPWRYFDDQGQEIKVANPDQPTETERANMVYAVHVRGSKPGDFNPNNNKGIFTSLPGVHSPRFYPRDITILTVQVIATRGRDMEPLLQPNRSTTFLVTATGLPERIYSSVVARNGHSKRKTL